MTSVPAVDNSVETIKSKIKIENDNWSQLSGDSQKDKQKYMKILTNEGPLSITEIKTRFMHKRASPQDSPKLRYAVPKQFRKKREGFESPFSKMKVSQMENSLTEAEAKFESFKENY